MRTRPACMAARISRSDRTAIEAIIAADRRVWKTRSASWRGLSAFRVPLASAGAATRSDLLVPFDLLALGHQRVDLALELLDVLEALVNAGKSDVSDLVELAQLVHRHLADRPRRN